jgi:lysozyme family protein
MMKNNFDTALAHVLKSEGLWSDNPKDPGGATMKGITFAVFKEWKRNPHLTKDDLKNISDQDVHDLYKQLYWDKIHGDDLPAGIDYAVFDSAVNMGVGRAAKLIQEAAGVTADGVIGSGTMQAIEKQNHRDLLQKFSHLKEVFYRSLGTFPTFGVGWLRRVAEVKVTADSMLG